MNDREVMQQALEALEKTMHAWGGTCAWHRDVKLSITALKAALAMHKVSEFAQAQEQAEPVEGNTLRMKDKIHALEPMLQALRIKQCVTFEEANALFDEVAKACVNPPPPFQISGNQWTAVVNLAVARFGSRAHGIKEGT